MNTFDYVRPATVQAAVVAASEPSAAYLAAGTNLLDLMKGGVTRPGRLVDITHLPDLDRIDELPDGGVRIGALVRNAELARNPSFARRFPAVARRFCPGRPRSFGTRRLWGVISCSARAAPISTTLQSPAINALPAQAVTPAVATTGCTP